MPSFLHFCRTTNLFKVLTMNLQGITQCLKKSFIPFLFSILVMKYEKSKKLANRLLLRFTFNYTPVSLTRQEHYQQFLLRSYCSIFCQYPNISVNTKWDVMATQLLLNV